MRGLRGLLRLILPVALLSAIFLWADAAGSWPVTWFDQFFGVLEPQLMPGYWLTGGHLILPLIFLALNLTNRRYGPSYAIAQIFIVWGILAAAYYYYAVDGLALRAQPLPPLGTTVAFVTAVFLSQIFNVLVFDWTRGNPWWRAPLYGPLWGSAVYCFIFHPLVNLGDGTPWVTQMITHFGFMAAISFLLLIPYFLLRSVLRPLPGYGGA